MRVVLANKFLYPRGGAERAVLTLGEELQRRGHAVHYFGMQHPDNAVPEERTVVVRRREYREGGAARLRDAAAMLYSLEARRRFARLLREKRPDVVHAHNIYHQLTPSILDAAREHGVPVLMTLHDYKLVCPRYDMLRAGRPCDACVEQGPAACLRHRCAGSWAGSLLLATEAALHRLRGSYDAVGRFLVPSRFLIAVLRRAGFDAARLHHLPNFAPDSGWPPSEAEPERFVYAGRLSPEKGVETLVRAARELPEGQLVLCGTGPLEARLRDMVRDFPDGRLALRGHLGVAALHRELAAASFVVAPSEWFENAPFAVLEAMAQGRAVLTTRMGGLPELISDGETGELLPPGDVAAWSAALLRAVREPQRMQRLGRAALERARRDFGLEQHVDRVESMYREVCGA